MNPDQNNQTFAIEQTRLPLTQSYQIYQNGIESTMSNTVQHPFHFGSQVNGYFNFNNTAPHSVVSNSLGYNMNVPSSSVSQPSGGNIPSSNVNNSHSIKTWKDLLKESYQFEDLMRQLGEITQINRALFVKYFKDESNERLNTKQIKNKIKFLRDGLFKNYLNYVNFKQEKIFPRDRTSIEMLEDIHVLSCCYVDKTINLNILNLFNGSSKEEESLCNEMKKMYNEQQDDILEKVKNENKVIIEKLFGLEKHLVMITQSIGFNFTSLKSEISELKSNFLVEKNSPQTVDYEQENNGKRKRNKYDNVENQLRQETIEEVDVEKEPTNSVQGPARIQSNAKDDELKKKNLNEKKIAKSSPEGCSKLTVSQSESHEKKAVDISYKNAVIKKPSKNVLQKIGINKTITSSGQAKITNVSKEADEWITVGKRQKGKNLNNKRTIVGSALSEVNGLNATSKSFSYYTGQWNPKVDPQKVYALVSSFARIINMIELSPNIPNRYYRAFKITVDSNYARAMTNEANWPAGIQVSRWDKRNQKRDKKTRTNLPVNNKAALRSSEEQNGHSSEECINENNLDESVSSDGHEEIDLMDDEASGETEESNGGEKEKNNNGQAENIDIEKMVTPIEEVSN